MGKDILCLIAAIVIITLDLWVISKIWGWHLEPLIDITAPSLATIFGLRVLYRVFRGDNFTPEKRGMATELISSFTITVGALTLGYIAYII